MKSKEQIQLQNQKQQAIASAEFSVKRLKTLLDFGDQSVARRYEIELAFLNELKCASSYAELTGMRCSHKLKVERNPIQAELSAK